MKYLDISDKIANDNAPTTLRIDKDHAYVITNSRKTMETVMAASKDMENEDDPVKQLDVLDEIIVRVLGKDAADYMADFSVKAKVDILEAITSTIGGGAETKK